MAAKKKAKAAKRSSRRAETPAADGAGAEDGVVAATPVEWPTEPVPRALAILDAIAAQIEAGRGKRQDDLIFSSGPEALRRPIGDPAPLDPDWAFCVPAAFCDSLDVKATTRRADGEARTVVTQGTSLAFGDGALLYDAEAARRASWGDAMQSVQRALRVDRGVPASASSRQPGIVECTVFERDKCRALVPVRSLALTQVDFVRLLIAGES